MNFCNLLFFLSFTTNAQKADSVKVNLQWHQKKYIKAEHLEEQYSSTSNSEDQLRNAPTPLVYGLNLLGIKRKNSFVERSFILAKVLLIQHIIEHLWEKASMWKGQRVETILFHLLIQSEHLLQPLLCITNLRIPACGQVKPPYVDFLKKRAEKKLLLAD